MPVSCYEHWYVYVLTIADAQEKPGFFMTEHSQGGTHKAPKPLAKSGVDGDKEPMEKEEEPATEGESGNKEKHKWDEYLLSILSRPTAQWIVTQKTDPTEQRYKVWQPAVFDPVTLFDVIVKVMEL